jgi:hypothetical protein
MSSKIVSSSLTKSLNKLKHFYPAGIKIVGKALTEAPERRSAQLGSGLTCKYKVKLDMVANDKNALAYLGTDGQPK